MSDPSTLTMCLFVFMGSRARASTVEPITIAHGGTPGGGLVHVMVAATPNSLLFPAETSAKSPAFASGTGTLKSLTFATPELRDQSRVAVRVNQSIGFFDGTTPSGGIHSGEVFIADAANAIYGSVTARRKDRRVG